MMHPRKFWSSFGPGVITGASDDDPSGIATYSQTGSMFGYRLLWLSLITTPMMIAVQEMSGRLGLVSGHGLAALIRRHYSATIALVLSTFLLVANIVNIGADLGALADVMKLLVPGPSWLYVVLFAAVILFLEIRLTYRRYVRVLKWLTLTLFLYVAVAWFIKIDWTAVLHGTFWPQVGHGKAFWSLVVAILGTTISPYLFFWETSEEVEERTGRRRMTPAGMVRQLRAMRRDTAVGMLFSNVIMFFIIVAAAATLHVHGVREITTAAQAAEVLQPIAGPLTFLLFSFGIIGTGLLAIPILAGSAAYAFAEVFGRSEGLSLSFRRAESFYSVIILSVILGVAVTLMHIPAFQLLLVAAVVNGLLAPVVLFFVIRLADNPNVVRTYRSPRWVRSFGWITFGLMALAGIVLLRYTF